MFGLNGAKPIASALTPHFKLHTKQSPTTNKEKQEMERIPYALVIGCLIQAMVCTGADIAYAIGTVSCFLSNPSKEY